MDNFSNIDLSSLLDEASGRSILDVDLSKIYEDEKQPRKSLNKGFSDESIKELASSIEQGGLKQPISLRSHPKKEGCFLINHGARRFLAFKKLGLNTIPAIIDESYTFEDQLIENIQREDLSTMEIAQAIFTLKERGVKPIDISKRVCKSLTSIQRYLRLIELPDVLKDLLNSEKVTDISLLYDLSNFHKKTENLNQFNNWLSNEEDITRTTFKKFVDSLHNQEKKSNDVFDSNVDSSPSFDNIKVNDRHTDEKLVDIDSDIPSDDVELDKNPKKPKEVKNNDADKKHDCLFQVSYKGENYFLVNVVSDKKNDKIITLRGKKSVEFTVNLSKEQVYVVATKI